MKVLQSRRLLEIGRQTALAKTNCHLSEERGVGVLILTGARRTTLEQCSESLTLVGCLPMTWSNSVQLAEVVIPVR